MRFAKFNFFWGNLNNSQETALVSTKQCDMPGCANRGEYKAPKSRYNLKDYYWFCLKHVQEYNSNWDYFKGMSAEEIENHVAQNIVGDRPTWRASEAGINAENIKQKIYKTFREKDNVFQNFTFTGENLSDKGNPEREFDINAMPNTAIEALKVMDLYPPVAWEDIRSSYKKLAKQHHPDKNKGCQKAEEKLKQINLAYSILKINHQKYKG